MNICDIFLKVRFFNRIKHLNVKLKCNESADKIRERNQEMSTCISSINCFETYLSILIFSVDRDLIHVFVGDFNKLLFHTKYEKNLYHVLVEY